MDKSMVEFFLIAATMVLLLFGFFAFLPTTRALWHRYRRNYAAAAEIYERLLARQPERLQLYTALAEIYLLLPRNDAQALQVFHKVLRFNLHSPCREEMEEILAQKCLETDGERLEDFTVLQEVAELPRA